MKFVVKMSESVKAALVKNGSWRHVAEFGDCIGYTDKLTEWPGTDTMSTEIDVRWQPSNLRYCYHVSELEFLGVVNADNSIVYRGQ